MPRVWITSELSPAAAKDADSHLRGARRVSVVLGPRADAWDAQEIEQLSLDPVAVRAKERFEVGGDGCGHVRLPMREG